jgi:hypothetical protein
MNESIWVLFSEFLGRLIDCRGFGTKVLLYEFLLRLLDRDPGSLNDLVESGVVSRVIAVLAQSEAVFREEQCSSQTLKFPTVNV